jgi:PleD family two-component response regulator
MKMEDPLIHNGTKGKVLVVDDEKLITELISEALHMEGDFNVEKASNGKEAFEKARAGSFACACGGACEK